MSASENLSKEQTSLAQATRQTSLAQATRQTSLAQATRQTSSAPALGQKLRAAREKLGLSAEDVSQAIKVQSSAVRHMEAGDFDALGPPVFARGFLRSYAKHVQLGQAWLDDELATLALDTAPILLPSRGERQERSSTAERGMLAASYLVGTAILVSAIFVVTHFDRFVGTRSEQAPLQVSAPQISTTESTMPLATPALDSTYPAVTGGAPSVLNPALSSPLAASTPSPLTAPDSSQAHITIQEASVQDAPSAVAAGLVNLPNLPADLQALELIASGTVWVEISDSTGRRLEFNNLSNGVRKSYSGKAPFTLKIGNAAFARLTAGGKAIDLNAFTNGSVAKLNLIESNGALVASAPISTVIEAPNPE